LIEEIDYAEEIDELKAMISENDSEAILSKAWIEWRAELEHAINEVK